MALDLSQYLTEIKADNPRLAVALQNIEDSINQTAQAAGTDATQHTEPPNPLNAINVAAGSDSVHVTLEDNTQRSRALNYFIEWSVNDPSFANSHVEHLVASRGRVLSLPPMDADSNPYTYYFRAYSAYSSSKVPSTPIVFGGKVPTGVTLSGNTSLTLLNSTGSGTAPSNGQRGASGFGKPQFALPGKMK